MSDPTTPERGRDLAVRSPVPGTPAPAAPPAVRPGTAEGSTASLASPTTTAPAAPATARASWSAESPAGPPSAWQEFPAFTHQYQRDYIALADQKAGAVFTASAALLAYLASQGAMDVFRHSTADWLSRGWLGAIASVLTAFASVLALEVVRPRGGRSVGVIYWEDVLQDATADAYADRIEHLSAREARRQVLLHIWTLAGINRRKYRALNRALWVAGLGFLATVAFVFTTTPTLKAS